MGPKPVGTLEMEELMNLKHLARFLLIPITLSLLGGQTILAADTPARPPMAHPAPQPMPAKPAAQKAAQNPWILYGGCAVAGWLLGSLASKWKKSQAGKVKARPKKQSRPEMPKFVNRTVLPLLNLAATTGALMAVLYGCHYAEILSPEMANKIGNSIISGGLGATLSFLYGQAVEKKEADAAEEKQSYIPTVTFSDLVGPRPEEVKDLVECLKDSALRKKLAEKELGFSKTYLLHGPPGTGKTQLVEAIAGEAGVHFHHITLAKTMNRYFGETEKYIEKIFEDARKHKGVIILFFDEFDSFAAKRNDDSRFQAYTAMVNTLLQEIAALQDDNDHIIAFAATNRLDTIDDAMLSRFDEIIFMGEPTQETIQKFIISKLKSKAYEGLVLNAGETHDDIAQEILSMLESKKLNFRDLRRCMEKIPKSFIIRNRAHGRQQRVLNSEFIYNQLRNQFGSAPEQPGLLQINNGVVTQAPQNEPERKEDANDAETKRSHATQEPPQKTTPRPPDRLADCAGILPQEVKDILDYINDPNKREEYGRFNLNPYKGILLYGPPGTGKTQIARSLAGEAQVPFFSYKASDFLAEFVGLSERNVRTAFDDARQAAQSEGNPKKIAILFIDELDGIGNERNHRGQAGNHASIIGELLAQMDGFEQDKTLIVLAATNKMESLDPALKRAGRFGTHVKVGLPNDENRKKILAHYLSKIPVEQTDEAFINELASITHGKSPADIRQCIDTACRKAVRAKLERIPKALLSQTFREEIAKEGNEKEAADKEMDQKINHQQITINLPHELPGNSRLAFSSDLERKQLHAQMIPTIPAMSPEADG